MASRLHRAGGRCAVFGPRLSIVLSYVDRDHARQQQARELVAQIGATRAVKLAVERLAAITVPFDAKGRLRDFEAAGGESAIHGPRTLAMRPLDGGDDQRRLARLTEDVSYPLTH